MSMIYDELRKRDLVKDEKELNELIWLRQIKINDKIIGSVNDFPQSAKKIKIGIYEFYVE